MRKTDKIYDENGEIIYSIYKWENLENGMVYFGKTIRDPLVRKIEHVSRIGKSNYYLHRAIASYTLEKFKFEVIFQCKSLDVLRQTEMDFIAAHNSNNKKYGYNLTAGGDGGETPNEETRLKKSLALKGKKTGPQSKEIIEKRVKALNAFYAENESVLLGIHRPKEISLKQAKFNTQEAIDNLELLKRQVYKQKELCEIFNCCENVLTKVFRRRGIYSIFK